VFYNRLLKYRSHRHATNHAIAQAVSKSEAIRLLYNVNHSSEVDPSKVRELYARILALGKRRVPTMSPFNPPHGFYVWSIVDHGSLLIQVLGRNVKETVLNLAYFVLQNGYQIERERQKYLYILTKKRIPVGKLYFAKGRLRHQACLIAKIGKEKLLFNFEHKGLFIDITLHCPRSVKSFILPCFKQFEQEFATLCCSALLPIQ